LLCITLYDILALNLMILFNNIRVRIYAVFKLSGKMKRKVIIRPIVLFLGMFFLLITSGNSLAQQERTFTINWKNPQEFIDVNDQKVYVPIFDKQSYTNASIYYQHREEVSAKFNARFELINYETVVAHPHEITFLQKESIIVSDTLNWEALVSNGASKRYLTISAVPFVRKNNIIHRISSFQIRQITTTYAKKLIQKSSNESVLRTGSGSWYKIAVQNDGVYKIDKQFLNNIGVNTDQLNPKHIHIYGNGDGLIPAQNNIPITDDLAKNAIIIVGEEDGTFDQGDYILFYAKGPHRWDYDPIKNRFVNVRHIYADQSCYFININANEPPLRIQNQSSVSLTATHNINSYSYRTVHENDWVNVSQSGQRWYGELFDANLSQTFNFSLPDPIPNGVSTAHVSMVASPGSSGSGIINILINGSTPSTTAIPSNSDNYVRTTQEISFLNSNSTISVNINFNRDAPSVHGYLDKIEINTRRQLSYSGTQFTFRDLESVGTGNIGQFSIQKMPNNGFIWNVHNKNNPTLVQGTFSGTTYSFRMPTDSLREYVVSSGNDFYTPSYVGRVNHQNLHALSQASYLIITHPDFLSQANRLANLHRSQGMSVHVVNVFDIYNEFSSGVQDAGAIRRFVKMFYDRSTSPADQINYVCLFGDGTYDPKNRVSDNASSNFIPTYQLIGVPTVENPQYNIVADDFYAILDDSEGMSAGVLPDVGVGRLIASNAQMAKEIVNKIEHYMKGHSSFYTQNNVNCIDGVSSSSFGSWRTRMGNIADFENYFMMNDQEPAYNYLKSNHPEINVEKLYLDAYPAVATLGGTRFPEVNHAVEEHFNFGSLLLNYVGHGGPRRLSGARIITIPMIEKLNNSDKLPVFVSATCEFTVFDDPHYLSAGERMFLNPNGGAIAMLTTTRKVAYSVNSQVIAAFFKNAFKRNSQHQPRTFGDILMHTKVETANSSSDKMAFSLIGDPALIIAMPKYKIVIDSINGISPLTQTDTIKALSKVTVKAHVEDFNGNSLSTFNGTSTSTLYDKAKQMKTRGQNPGQTIFHANANDYELQQNVLYRGKSTVKNGFFEFEFIVPKDIDYSYGKGKFSLYADDQNVDAIGEEQRLIVGGVNPNGLSDNTPPEVHLYINHESFVNGGITDQTPFLIAKIYDDNGINTAGNSIGHDLIAILDNNTNHPILLNNYFIYDVDSYQKGTIRYQMPNLSPGKHTILLKVWDVNNNLSQETIEFVVQEKENLALSHVLNYPNPFTTNTEFYFEHNRCCTELEVQIQIFTVSGRLVKTINRWVYTPSFRSEGIRWDGKDDFGDSLARGVYVYRIKVRTPDNAVAEKLEKLVLL